jgi:hypothetical protein
MFYLQYDNIFIFIQNLLFILIQLLFFIQNFYLSLLTIIIFLQNI